MVSGGLGMNERPTGDVATGRSWHVDERPPEVSVDRLEEPSRPHSPWRRALAAGVVAALLAGGVLTSVLTHHAGSDAAPSGSPTPPAGQGHRSGGSAGDAVVPPAAGIRATGRIAGTFSPGDTLVFDVTLQASRFFSLRPCPSYTITFASRTTTRRLSCARVPYLASLVHPDGQVTGFRPVLPAGTDVIFRIRVTVPDTIGLQHVRWALHGTRPRPALSGVVQVVAPGSG
jgi:hypothetical protein